MPIVPTFDSSKLKELRAALKEIDPALTREMNKSIKNVAGPVANNIKAALPKAPILSGMNNEGRTAVDFIRATAYGPARGSLARIEVFSPKPAGFKIADLAGTKNALSNFNKGYSRKGPSGYVTVKPHATTSGRALIDGLNKVAPLLGRGGRFGWREFIAERPRMVSEVVKIIDKFCDKTRGDLTR